MQISGKLGSAAFAPPLAADAAPRRAGEKPAEVAQPADAAAHALTADKVEAAVSALNDSLQPLATGLQFELDKETHKTVVKLVDRETGTVIRQYPSEELLAIARAMDRAAGGLLRGKA